jgi:5'-nucleotidase
MADRGSSSMRHQRPGRSGHRARRLVLAVVLVAAAVPISAATATAQPCDPFYGCTPAPSVPPSTPPTCSTSATVATGGQVLSASVANAPAGAAIQITIDGVTAGSGAADATGSATIAFTVPAGIAPGTHAVFAVGAGFSASCGDLSVEGVQSNVVENPAPGGGGAAGVAGDDVARGRSGGSLARTGIELALLLAIALALLVVGRRLIAAERRRRRRRARQHNVIADLAEHAPSSLHP